MNICASHFGLYLIHTQKKNLHDPTQKPALIQDTKATIFRRMWDPKKPRIYMTHRRTCADTTHQHTKATRIRRNWELRNWELRAYTFWLTCDPKKKKTICMTQRRNQRTYNRHCSAYWMWSQTRQVFFIFSFSLFWGRGVTGIIRVHFNSLCKHDHHGTRKEIVKKENVKKHKRYKAPCPAFLDVINTWFLVSVYTFDYFFLRILFRATSGCAAE